MVHNGPCLSVSGQMHCRGAQCLSDGAGSLGPRCGLPNFRDLRREYAMVEDATSDKDQSILTFWCDLYFIPYGVRSS